MHVYLSVHSVFHAPLNTRKCTHTKASRQSDADKNFRVIHCIACREIEVTLAPLKPETYHYIHFLMYKDPILNGMIS